MRNKTALETAHVHMARIRGGRLAVLLFSAAVAASLLGCGNTGPGEDVPAQGKSMAGAVVDVKVSPSALAAVPRPWVLDDPESAVRSYLDWVSYAWRTGRSQVATPTMTPYEEVRVDSYVQYNVQKGRLIDQSLDSIRFGAASIIATTAVVPAREDWTYRYVSITEAGKTTGGPYKASYETTYTLVRSDSGWVVDSVQAKALGEVK